MDLKINHLRKSAFGQKRTFERQQHMFTWLNNQGVKSSDGFEVQSVDRFAIEYREGSLVVTVPVELGSYGGDSSVRIPATAFTRWDNYRPVNSPQKQAQMRANFVAAMHFQNVTVEA